MLCNANVATYPTECFRIVGKLNKLELAQLAQGVMQVLRERVSGEAVWITPKRPAQTGPVSRNFVARKLKG